jgi:hypothetical protein
MGNKAREQVVGVDLINLATFLRAWPKAHLEEMTVFLYNKGGPLYSIKVISKCLDELKITKKRASTEAYQAQSDDEQLRVWIIWNFSSPLGIFKVPRQKLIDIDEFGILLEKCNHTGGWALRVFRVRKDGHYHYDAKITVLLPSSRRIRLFCHTSVGVFSILGIGFILSMEREQQLTFFGTFVVEKTPF